MGARNDGGREPRKLARAAALPRAKRLSVNEVAPLARAVGPALREERKRRGWSQELLAEKSGVSQGEISALESGRCAPKIETMERLARGFGRRLSGWIARLERGD